jgi:hypothetical protein
MNDKFSDEALQKAWGNFQKSHKDISARVSDDLRQKGFSMARSMYRAIGSNFSKASGPLNKKQKADLVRQAIDGVIMANNDICEWYLDRDAVFALAEFVCRSVIAQGRVNKNKPPESLPPRWAVDLQGRLAELSDHNDLLEAA